jgi:HK97 family phage portal protein
MAAKTKRKIQKRAQSVKRITNTAKTEPENAASSRLIFTGRTNAGVYVTPDTALKNATVWACVQYLTRQTAQLPWRVMRDFKDGGAELVPSNPADYVLHTRPCPDMGPFTWRQSMLGTALLWGNSYAEIQWDNRGAVYALWPIHPDRVNVRRNRETGVLEYEVWNQGGRVTLDAADVFHVRGFGDGPVGYNVVEYAAQSIGWAQATEVFGSTFFGEGMNPSGIVETTAGLSQPAMEILRAELEKLYKGPKGKRTAILDAGMKFQKLATQPNDAQFIETRIHQVEEVCRWFGVPPHKVMHLLRATFSNIESQSIEVVVDAVTPWCKIFEEEANYKFFGPQNRAGVYTKIDTRALLRGDHAARAAFYKSMFELGMSINQILALEDFNGIGPDGDVRFVSNNVQTLDRAIRGQPVKLQPKPGDPLPPDQQPALPAKTNGAGNGVASH